MTARMPSFLRGLILLLLVACPALVHAATLNVPSAAYPTIQSGVDAAANGDTVLIADGTYTGDGNRDIDFHGKSLTVTSQNGPAKTIIDCGGYASTDGSGNHRGFYIHSGETDELHAVVSGLTINNGYELVIAGVTDSGRGGGICIDGGYVSVQNCIVVNNFAYQGGGVYDYNPQSETTSLTSCTIGNNNAQLSGGGVWNYNATNDGIITLTDCTVTGNSTMEIGGGIANYCNGIITLADCAVTDNKTADQGGGIFNVAANGGVIKLTNCTVSGNSAAEGGGILNDNEGSNTITLTNCTFGNNSARAGAGIEEFGDATIVNSVFIGNVSGSFGGGLEASRGASQITNCTFFANMSGIGGDAISAIFDFGTPSGSATVRNCILWDVTGSEEIAESGMGVSVDHSDVYRNSIEAGPGNINSDPLFVNAAAGDLHLQSGSPCLGAGTTDGAPPSDLDGNPRPNPPSMGAYELAAPLATISAFTLTPAQINAPGPTVTADVTATGSFSKVTVSPAPGSLSGALPTFTLVNSGLDWKAALPTLYLRLAKTNPVTFIATGTRSDGTTTSMTATLRIGALPSLTLSVNSDKSTVPAGLTFSVKGIIRNLTTTPASATVTISVPSQLIFVPSVGFTYDAALNAVTWTGPLAASTGSYTFSAEFQASQYAKANTQITINATASAPNFQSATQPAYIVIDAPPVPLGIDIDTSGAAGQADGTAIITSTVGIAPLQAIISPVSGLEHAWLGVDHAFDASGGPLSPTKDLSPGSLAAALGVAGPGLPPTYSASFPRIGSQCNIGLRLTPTAAAMNIQSIALTLLGGLLGPDADSPAEVIEFYEEFDKLDAFRDASNELMHPATTPWGKAFQVAYIAHDFLTMNPHDIDTIATFLSTKTGKTIAGQAVKDALGVVGTGRAILEIGQIIADEAIFTGFTGGADAEITFTGSAFKHQEELNKVSSHHLNGNTQHH